MFRYFFAFILFIHALIHLIGALKGFNLMKISSISKPISKTTGSIWFLTFLLLVFGLLLFVFKNHYWSFFLVSSALISQMLIILYWSDAKAGTIVNIIILTVGIIGYSIWNFKTKSNIVAEKILKTESISEKQEIITKESISNLPQIVQKWLTRSGTIGKSKVHTVRLKQKGMIRTNPYDDWMPAEAIQYFTIDKPAFVWIATINKGSLVPIYGRDEYENGKGHMLIKVFSMFTVADAMGDKLDQGTLLRFLAEIEWFPSAAIAPYIKWEQLNEYSAKATMTYGNTTASGVFTYNELGDITNFEAMRYKENKGTYTLEKWIIPITAYNTFEGIRIPSKGEAIWDLKGGAFNWFQWEITDINYNVREHY